MGSCASCNRSRKALSVLGNLFGNSKAGITMSINDDVIGVLDKIALKLEAGFDERKFNAYLGRAALEGARYLEPKIEAEAPVDTGRLRNSVRSKMGRYKKPSAIAGINLGKGRKDMRGAYYGRAVVSGTGDQWSYPGLKATRGAIRAALKEAGTSNRQYATNLLRQHGYYETYTHKPLPARPFVEETGARERDNIKRVVSDTIDKILQDEVFRDTIKIKKR